MTTTSAAEYALRGNGTAVHIYREYKQTVRGELYVYAGTNCAFDVSPLAPRVRRVTAEHATCKTCLRVASGSNA